MAEQSLLARLRVPPVIPHGADRNAYDFTEL
jgi:hypothetical protein